MENSKEDENNKESTKKEDLFKGMSVYARAIVDLGNKLKDEN